PRRSSDLGDVQQRLSDASLAVPAFRVDDLVDLVKAVDVGTRHGRGPRRRSLVQGAPHPDVAVAQGEHALVGLGTFWIEPTLRDGPRPDTQAPHTGAGQPVQPTAHLGAFVRSGLAAYRRSSWASSSRAVATSSCRPGARTTEVCIAPRRLYTSLRIARPIAGWNSKVKKEAADL